jgi:hypothetical protein
MHHLEEFFISWSNSLFSLPAIIYGNINVRPSKFRYCKVQLYLIQLPSQVEKSRIQIQRLNLSNMQQEMAGSAANAGLGIPESVGLYVPEPSSVKGLVEPGSVRRITRSR